MLFIEFGIFLVAQPGERMGKALSGRARDDDVIDKPTSSGREGIGKLCTVFGSTGGNLRRVVEFVVKYNFDRALGPHHRNLGGGPGVVNIALQMLRAHDVVGTAIGFSGNHG